MRFIYALILAQFASPVFSAELKTCSKYKFQGDLSSELKDKPFLKTWNESGVPIFIELELKNGLGIDTIGFRGKFIEGEVIILKQIAKRKYTGHLESIKPALRPSNIDKSPLPFFIEATKCQ